MTRVWRMEMRPLFMSTSTQRRPNSSPRRIPSVASRSHAGYSRLADALGISMDQLAGKVNYDLDLSGDWWCAWQTWKDGAPRIDTHPLEVHQRGEVLQLNAERAVPVAEGSYRWRGELRLWDNEALIGWYRSTDAAVRSKGTLYLALHQHGTYAWGRWVGMSYDGPVVTGWGAIARTEEQAHQVVLDFINDGRS